MLLKTMNEKNWVYLCMFQSSSKAETDDNISEQRRQTGKRVRYGEIIQVIQMSLICDKEHDFIIRYCTVIYDFIIYDSAYYRPLPGTKINQREWHHII